MLRRMRPLALLVLAALVIGLVPSGNADRPDPRLRPEVMHPWVTNEGAYLNNGYAHGAHVLSLPGNMVGFSEDGTIAATFSSGGLVKGYRLATGEVAWQADREQTEALRCRALIGNPDLKGWYSHRNVAHLWCWHEGEQAPIAALDLGTGRWIDLAFFTRYHDLQFRGYRDGFMQVTVRSRSGEVRFVLLDFEGNEAYSLSVFSAADGVSLDQSGTWCWMVSGRIYCWRHQGELWTFDAATRRLLRKFEAAGRVDITADGYSVRTDIDEQVYLYDLSGQLVGSTDEDVDRSCPFTPYWGVEYANADLASQSTACLFKLVGPSGRVFAVQFSYADSFVLLPQAGVKIPTLDSLDPGGIVSLDESVIALVPEFEAVLSPDGVRLFDPYTGRLIDSFPLPWASMSAGIIYWTAKNREPDNPIGTQVLVPGP